MNMIKSERDVRRWVSKKFGDAALWVEHSSGGSVGFPDCLILHNSGPRLNQNCWPLELKYGSIKNGFWSGELRPAQVQVGQQFTKHGVKMHIMVGSKCEKVLWMCSFENYFHRYGTDIDTKMEPVNSRYDVVSVLVKK